VRKTSLISFLAFLVILGITAPLFAGNGANLIGLTPQSAGRGGVGIGTAVGVESLTKNPAMLSKVTQFESIYCLNGVFVEPSVRVQYPDFAIDSGEQESQTKRFVIPEIGFVFPYSDSVVMGIGLFGTSGFGVDYRNNSAGSGALANTRMFLMSLKAVPGISYKKGDFSAGLSAHLGYGLLNFAAQFPDATGDPNTAQQRGGGIGESFSAGFQVGTSYDFFDSFTLGATYQSSIPFSYKRVFDFDRNGTYDDFDLTMPQELGIGVSETYKKWEFSADIKRIYWSSADGFKQLRWEDQTVYAAGAEYTAIPDKLFFRLGANYSPPVVKNRSDLSVSNGTFPLSSGTFLDSNIAYFDTVGLGPVIAGESITLGGGYRITEHLELNVSLEVLMQRSITQSGKATFNVPGDTDSTDNFDNTDASYKVTNKGYILSAAMSWLF